MKAVVICPVPYKSFQQGGFPQTCYGEFDGMTHARLWLETTHCNKVRQEQLAQFAWTTPCPHGIDVHQILLVEYPKTGYETLIL